MPDDVKPLAVGVERKEELFVDVFDVMLDYDSNAFKKRCAKWGLDTFDLLEKHARIMVPTNGYDKGYFIYAVALAHIIGQFGNRAFNNKNSNDGIEFDLGRLGLNFEDVECYLEEDISEERRRELRRRNYLGLDDIWTAMREWTDEIYKELISYYKKPEDPTGANHVIYSTLLKTFEKDVHEEGFIITSNFTEGGEMSAYSYVTDGFLY